MQFSAAVCTIDICAPNGKGLRSRKEACMKRRDFLKAAAFSTMLTSCVGHETVSHQPEAPRQNFVFILADDLGWTDLGCFGSSFYDTPCLDRLAGEGMRFTDAYAACPVCSPSRVSIMTGKYPARLHTTDWFGAPQPDTVENHPTRDKALLPAPYVEQLPLSEVTLAEAFKEAGYRTFFAGKWHLGGKGFYPEDQGFDINKGGYEKGSPNSYYSPYQNPKLTDGPEGEHLPRRLAEESVAFLEKNGKKPFVLFLSFYSVHTPLKGREDLVRKYEARAKERNQEQAVYKEIDGRQVRQVQNDPQYGATVEAMDESVGMVLGALNRLGLSESTAVFFTSDNGGLSTSEGTPTSNVPLRAGKGWLYEGGIRVPLIVRWPGHTAAGSVSSRPVAGTDFYPTMLEIAGLPARPHQHCDGMSVVPCLQGKNSKEERPLFWHYPHYGNQGGSPGAAVRMGRYKLLEFFEDNRIELYNLQEDPGETENLADEMPNYADAYLELLHDWQQECGARFPSPNPKAAAQPESSGKKKISPKSIYHK